LKDDSEKKNSILIINRGEEAGHSRIVTRIGISLVLQVGVQLEFCLVILVILEDFAIYAGTHTA
jgi:hypothetical protein